MTRSRTILALAGLLTALTLSSCSDDKVTPPPQPALSTITLTLPSAPIMIGQTATATIAGADQAGLPFALGPVVWTSSSEVVAKVDANGVITGVGAGTAQITATSGGKSGQQQITIVAPAGIKINEIESNGGTPGDWAELYNPTTAPVDLSNWVVKDNDDTHSYKIPQGTVIQPGGYVLTEEAGFGFGLGAPDAVRLYSPYGTLVDSYDWTTHATTTYGRCPNGTGVFATTTTSTKGAANDCSIAIKINEVESNGGTPGDWVELYNAGPSTVDLSGYVFKDNDDTHNYTLPAGSTIAAGAYLVLEEAQFTFGLGAPDAARLFSPAGAVVDSYSWDTHATTTYGRCPNGAGTFATTGASTKGTANNCGSTTGPATSAWPGLDDVVTIDGAAVFGGNLSGLHYEGANGSTPAVIWAARNGPGTLFRLVFNGTIWTPDATNGWSAGKALRYPNGTGDPDAEGVTYAAGGSSAGIYISTERDNSNNSVSRNAILRFDPTASGSTLTATHEWNLTADLPVTGANLGIEGITWVPDTFLVAQKFFDEKAGHTYVPSEYANHGAGIFFVGVEANGLVYAYALDHSNSTFKRLSTIQTGFTNGVMDLSFDRELGYLWAICDDGCGGKLATLEIDQKVGATQGRFAATRLFDRPASMPNLNNEGFTFAPLSECTNGRRFAYWTDDSETGGHSLRRASLTCQKF